MVVWQFIQTSINESGLTFWTAQHVILQTPLPFSIFAYRMVARNLLILAHNFVIVPIVLVLLQIPVGLSVLIAVPALLVLAMNAVWVGIFFGIVCARFRDISPIVQNAVQVLFFVTPIFWDPAALGKWQFIAELNPLFAAVDVIRAPLTGKSPAEFSWTVLLLVTIVGWVGTFALFARFRSRIAYWI
jgi:ABC-type polysaccharide/polyol phosphate export permease